MTGTQKLMVTVVTLFIAFSRLTAVSQSMWEWDEALFASAVREYDVTQHHPHPPGYPLHIGAAKLLRPITGDDFRAVQSVVVAAAMLMFPALFALARAVGFGFRTSLCGAALYCFLPNVWYYGGTAFSDVPATVLGIAACAMLMRGAESRRWYIAGSVLLAISIGFRPQNLLMGLVPGILATWKRGRESVAVVIVAAVAGISIVSASYGGAALASHSPQTYLEILQSQQEYVSRVDSFQNPGRPPLWPMAKLFLVKVIDNKRLIVILTILAGVSILSGLLQHRKPVLMSIAIFAPIAILAWLMLDPGAVSRYSIAYLPLYALLAADTLGAGFLRTREPGSIGLRPFARPLIQASLVALLASAFVRWTLPALRVVRENDAPNVAALKWAREKIDPTNTLYVTAGLGPFADYYLKGRRLSYFASPAEIGVVRDAGHSYAVSVDGANESPMVEWKYTRGKLWKLARQRYFEAEIGRLPSRLRFSSGWYDEEGSGEAWWRWMGAKSVTLLPALRGRGVLRLDLSIPIPAIAPPTVAITWNGLEVDRFVATTAQIVRSLPLTSRDDDQNELVITTTNVARSPGDPRDLGVCLNSMAWNPAP